MKCIITIASDSEALTGENRSGELMRILREQANRVENSVAGHWNIRDINGNHVGTMHLFAGTPFIPDENVF